MKKPNILFITTDQQRFDTICALGNDKIYTPHLNWLVDDGITYTNCYSDSPVCMAARATIMVGKHGYNTGLTGNSDEVRPMENYPTLPGILTSNGYQTRAQGKMHFSPMRANYGFEHMELPRDYYRDRLRNRRDGLPKQHGVGENEVEPVISTVDEINSLTYWTVDRSIDFLETRDETRPFFLWTSFTKPHPPLDPVRNYWDLYRDKILDPPTIGEWSKIPEDVPQGFMYYTYMLNNIHRLSKDQKMDVKRAYYACITQIDYSLGLLFGRLRELDLLDNTWIIFTSDHGDMQGDHHMGAKSTFFEGASHIPFIVRPPGAPWTRNPLAGTKCSDPITLADVLPTLLDLAGIENPTDIDGSNLLNLLDAPKNRTFYGVNNEETFAIKKDGLKYQISRYGGGEVMFDLINDPKEQFNLIDSCDYKDSYEALKADLIAKIKDVKPHLVANDELILLPIIDRKDVNLWPGFHSIGFDCDVLH